MLKSMTFAAALTPGAVVIALALGASAQGQGSYPERAPLEQYRMASADEIALARSAAPAAISSHAEILTLGAHGYETAVKGDNGFVCFVDRSWAQGFDDAEFWNPKMRAPMCLNRAAARSVMLSDMKRAEWALAGASRTEMRDRTKAAIAAKEITPPEVGAMSYMMSKDGYLNDQAGHWHPHVMFYMPRIPTSDWGADVPGGAVMGDSSSLEPLTVFFVPVPKWSDGTPAAMAM
jgi:hypothetical protein